MASHGYVRAARAWHMRIQHMICIRRREKERERVKDGGIERESGGWRETGRERRRKGLSWGRQEVRRKGKEAKPECRLERGMGVKRSRKAEDEHGYGSGLSRRT
eukprot:1752825-Pleurochrysis_carterae.AAC.1